MSRRFNYEFAGEIDPQTFTHPELGNVTISRVGRMYANVEGQAIEGNSVKQLLGRKADVEANHAELEAKRVIARQRSRGEVLPGFVLNTTTGKCEPVLVRGIHGTTKEYLILTPDGAKDKVSSVLRDLTALEVEEVEYAYAQWKHDTQVRTSIPAPTLTDLVDRDTNLPGSPDFDPQTGEFFVMLPEGRITAPTVNELGMKVAFTVAARTHPVARVHGEHGYELARTADQTRASAGALFPDEQTARSYDQAVAAVQASRNALNALTSTYAFPKETFKVAA